MRGFVPLEGCAVTCRVVISRTGEKPFALHVALPPEAADRCSRRHVTIAAFSEELQALWYRALVQAGIPRPELLARLALAGRLEELASSRTIPLISRESSRISHPPLQYQAPPEDVAYLTGLASRGAAAKGPAAPAPAAAAPAAAAGRASRVPPPPPYWLAPVLDRRSQHQQQRQRQHQQHQHDDRYDTISAASYVTEPVESKRRIVYPAPRLMNSAPHPAASPRPVVSRSRLARSRGGGGGGGPPLAPPRGRRTCGAADGTEIVPLLADGRSSSGGGRSDGVRSDDLAAEERWDTGGGGDRRRAELIVPLLAAPRRRGSAVAAAAAATAAVPEAASDRETRWREGPSHYHGDGRHASERDQPRAWSSARGGGSGRRGRGEEPEPRGADEPMGYDAAARTDPRVINQAAPLGYGIGSPRASRPDQRPPMDGGGGAGRTSRLARSAGRNPTASSALLHAYLEQQAPLVSEPQQAQRPSARPAATISARGSVTWAPVPSQGAAADPRVTSHSRHHQYQHPPHQHARLRGTTPGSGSSRDRSSAAPEGPHALPPDAFTPISDAARRDYIATLESKLASLQQSVAHVEALLLDMQLHRQQRSEVAALLHRAQAQAQLQQLQAAQAEVQAQLLALQQAAAQASLSRRLEADTSAGVSVRAAAAAAARQPGVVLHGAARASAASAAGAGVAAVASASAAAGQASRRLGERARGTDAGGSSSSGGGSCGGGGGTAAAASRGGAPKEQERSMLVQMQQTLVRMLQGRRQDPGPGEPQSAASAASASRRLHSSSLRPASQLHQPSVHQSLHPSLQQQQHHHHLHHHHQQQQQQPRQHPSQRPSQQLGNNNLGLQQQPQPHPDMPPEFRMWRSAALRALASGEGEWALQQRQQQQQQPRGSASLPRRQKEPSPQERLQPMPPAQLFLSPDTVAAVAAAVPPKPSRKAAAAAAAAAVTSPSPSRAPSALSQVPARAAPSTTSTRSIRGPGGGAAAAIDERSELLERIRSQQDHRFRRHAQRPTAAASDLSASTARGRSGARSGLFAAGLEMEVRGDTSSDTSCSTAGADAGARRARPDAASAAAARRGAAAGAAAAAAAAAGTTTRKRRPPHAALLSRLQAHQQLGPLSSS
ncbi:hypothetical protein PLESTB_000835700 [Pleodorina starrii]|uniref:Uncharacterized protein n=1 Tax=Pleodorina starrii TaxID=330485 RepID=A0A9W6BLX8_9CHLO|nr:hypothetical protein PLESTM_000151400 [Pleodorina starrii]GLC54215.1 hypothetical protein PLESTB_000835700 [Pleodorina starrii]